MKRATFILSATLFLASSVTPVWGQTPSDIPDVIVIQVSPQTLNLDWNTRGDPEVTVHAEIPYALFVGGDLEIWLGDVQAVYIKSDARGDLVAKFPFDLLIENMGPGFATLTLEAWDTDGNHYFGSDEVRLILP